MYFSVNTQTGDAIDRHLRSERPYIAFPRYQSTVVKHWVRSSGQPPVPQRPLRNSNARHWMAHDYIMIMGVTSCVAEHEIASEMFLVNYFCGEVAEGVPVSPLPACPLPASVICTSHSQYPLPQMSRSLSHQSKLHIAFNWRCLNYGYISSVSKQSPGALRSAVSCCLCGADSHYLFPRRLRDLSRDRISSFSFVCITFTLS